MNNNFYGIERKENETDFEFCWHCICAKIEGAIQCDWQDIVEYFELGVHRDSLRKSVNVGQFSAYNIYKYMEDKIVELSTSDSPQEMQEDLLMQLEMKKVELQKERVKISTLRNELNKTVRQESRRELFYTELRDAIANNPLQPVQFEALPIQNVEKEYLLTFADVHYGATFDVGFNKYSPSICEERFSSLFNQVIEIVKEESINHLHIASQGDLVQGVLRLTDISLNSITMIEQIMGIARLVANFLNQVSQYTRITYHHCINANHSELRLLGSKSGELAEDVELLIGNYIKDLLANNARINVNIGTETVMDITLGGYNVGLLHGQDVRNKETYIRDLSVMRHKEYDYLIMGHIHHYTCATVSTTKDGNPVQVISVPSIVGSCPYSQKIMKTAPSGALLLCFKEGKGKSNTYELNLN